MYFSMKAVSDFALENIARPTTDSALWLRMWESLFLLYSIWNLSKFDFWEEQSFSFFQTITKIWAFLISSKLEKLEFKLEKNIGI